MNALNLSCPAPLRVCIVTETYAPDINGVAHTLSRLVAGLTARGHELHVVHPHLESEPPAGNHHVARTRVPGLALPFYRDLRLGLPAGARLRRLWRQWRPDVVYVATEGPLGWTAVGQAAAARIPAASGFHTNFHTYSTHYGFGLLAGPIYGYLRHLHNRTRRTLVPTRSLRDQLDADGFRAVTVLGRGVDAELFSPARRSTQLRSEWGLGPDDRAVLYVGRLAAEKNIPLALRAYERMRQVDPRLRLVLIGDGPLRERIATDHPQVVLCGARTGLALAQGYASADIFLFPSRSETYGNVVPEAMASGLAVVAFDYAGARELISDGHNGLLVPFADDQRFIDSAAGLLERPERIGELGRNARATAAVRRWETVVDRFESILYDIHREGVHP